MAAVFLQQPDIALDKDEAQILAHAIAEVNKHYKLPIVRPEHAALGALAGAVFAVYKPKLTKIRARKTAPPAPQSQAQAQPPAGYDAPVTTAPSWFPSLGEVRPN